MFDVLFRGNVYRVYSVQQHNGITEFLVYDGKFKWINAANCKPHEEVY